MISKVISSKKFNFGAIALIAVLTLLCYFNSLKAAYQFDDDVFINEQRLAQGPLKILTAPNALKDNRLIGNISFAINYSLYGLDPVGFHVGNLIIHLINGIILYFLVAALFKTPALTSNEINKYSGFIALLSALLFVSHPVQTQAVTYIVQRFASLCTMFYLLAMLLYVKFRLTEKRSVYIKVVFYILALLSTCLAMRTKEIAFTLPTIIAVLEFIFFTGTRKRVLYLLPFFLTMVIIPLSLVEVNKPVGDVIADVVDVSKDDTTVSRSVYFFTQLRVINTYLRLLFLPINQNFDYDYPLYRSFWIPDVVLSAFLIFVLLAAGAYFIFRARKSGRQELALISFGIYFFFVALAVESSIIPIRDVINEHRLYLPSTGFFIAFSVIFFLTFRILLRDRALIGFILVSSVLVIALSTGTILRNKVWQTKLSLWTDVVSKSPNKARGHNNLGNCYFIQKDFVSAIPAYKKAIALDHEWYESYYNLAISLEKIGKTSDAVYYYLAFAKEAPPHYNHLKHNILKKFGLKK